MIYKTSLRIKMWVSIFIMMLLTVAFSLQAAEGEKAFEHETGFYYTVQKGDTLWDLSQKFSDSAWLWPEMWQENSQIANPHRIYPGERIRLYRRTGSQKMAEKKLGKPLSLKSSMGDLIHYNYTALDRVGFIRKQPVTPHGAIFKVQETKEMIYSNDIVYIRPEGGFELVPGKRYTVYRTLAPIRDRVTNAYIGIQHLLTGVVEITQVEAQYAMGLIIEAYRPIELDDMLMPYYRRLPKIIIKDSPKGLQGRILEAEDHNRLIGDNMIAFMNKGKKDGVQPGQFYNVYFQAQERIHPKKGEKTLLLPVDFAELLVIHTENTTATVIVTNADKEFEPGTAVHSPNR
ncbi:MAG: LysM domain-containing protein [Desulfobacterales bacterium]|jgi:hypothetical protein